MRLMPLIPRLEAQPHTVWIQRLNPISQVQDCLGLGEWMGQRRGQIRIQVWRCRIGREDHWHHGHSMSEAVNAALMNNET